MTDPITLEPFNAPVHGLCGHDVQLESILRWLQESKTCPVCRTPMRATDLRFSHAAYMVVPYDRRNNTNDAPIVPTAPPCLTVVPRDNWNSIVTSVRNSRLRHTSTLFNDYSVDQRFNYEPITLEQLQAAFRVVDIEDVPPLMTVHTTPPTETAPSDEGYPPMIRNFTVNAVNPAASRLQDLREHLVPHHNMHIINEMNLQATSITIHRYYWAINCSWTDALRTALRRGWIVYDLFPVGRGYVIYSMSIDRRFNRLPLRPFRRRVR